MILTSEMDNIHSEKEANHTYITLNGYIHMLAVDTLQSDQYSALKHMCDW